MTYLAWQCCLTELWRNSGAATRGEGNQDEPIIICLDPVLPVTTLERRTPTTIKRPFLSSGLTDGESEGEEENKKRGGECRRKKKTFFSVPFCPFQTVVRETGVERCLLRGLVGEGACHWRWGWGQRLVRGELLYPIFLP